MTHPNPSTVSATVAVLVFWLSGCSFTGSAIKCPDNPDNPRPVFLLDHGRHRTLVLTDGSGGYLQRYGYGDWRYYAEADKTFWSGARALLWPTRASLGRREYEVTAPTLQAVESAVRVGILEIHPLEVEGGAVDALRQELDTIFQQGARQQLFVNELRDFEFAPHPRKYWLGYNSNHAVADWIRSLDCEI